uniref:Uncharacterized protein n=1 Tax=Anguilla anguilla TaxID=7936 RepID=A0A0E9TZZ6_ANGAN
MLLMTFLKFFLFIFIFYFSSQNSGMFDFWGTV